MDPEKVRTPYIPAVPYFSSLVLTRLGVSTSYSPFPSYCTDIWLLFTPHI